MKLTFWGAARQVPGSMFLLELDDGYKILIDCGLDMGKTEDKPIYPGASFPFEASQINTLVLTHAHLDHSGKIPNLLREGFEGQVLCTSPTLALSELLLHDSANLNQKKLKVYHKKKFLPIEKRPDIRPGDLYNERHVKEAIERFVPIAFHQKFNIKKGLDITMIPTGHLLGAGNVLFEVHEKGTIKRLLFSGDIGRKNYPLLPDPAIPPQVDYVVCETTYGNRLHTSAEDTRAELKRVIKQTCVDRPGRLIIPAFSIGRTQAVLYTLHQMYDEGELPPVKVFADSPLAQRSNMVYERSYKFLNQEAQEFRNRFGSLFDFDTLHYVETEKQSKAISNHNEPCIIISASGMMEGGRIQHHVRNNLANPYCTIMMVGYSAEGTMGHRLRYNTGILRVGSREMLVDCRIEETDAFSGHGDLNDLLEFVGHQKPELLKKVFLVHGEEGAMHDFKNSLGQRGYNSVEIPERGQTFEL